MTSLLPSELVSAARQLSRWGTADGRTLPWRYSGDEYRLGVAEVLLQKTKADAVVPVWETVTARYPTAAALASAKSDDLWRLVSPLGLGTQRTARLYALARSLEGRVAYGGVGPYGSAMLALEAGRTPDDPTMASALAARAAATT